MAEELVAVSLLLIAGGGLGLPVGAFAGRRCQLPGGTAMAVALLAGTTGIGLLTFLAGYAGMLHPYLLPILAVAGLVVVSWRAADVRSFVLVRVVPGCRRALRRHAVVGTVLVAGLFLALAAGMAPPFRTDEIEYHWVAPLAWAQHGSWNESPYRLVNAFPFMEVVYTAPATMDAYVAAHWIHLTTLMALGLGAAGLGSALGLRGQLPIAAGIMVAPVTWLQSFAAYNDVAAASFSLVALSVLVGGAYSRWATALAACLLVVGISIKPTTAVATGVLVLVVVLARTWRTNPWPTSWRRAFWVVVPIVLAATATIVFWTVRQHLYTGHWVDPAMTAKPDAYARTMLPDRSDRLLAPLMPFVLGILGGSEPWGGRTPLVVQVFLVPAVVYAVWRRGRLGRRFALLAVPAYVHWIVLGAAIVRTRFHILSWALLVVAVRVVVEEVGERHPRVGTWLERLWTLIVVVAMVDVLRQTFDVIRLI